MTAEKETCNTLEGLSETLANKYKPQYNEMIKFASIQKTILVWWRKCRRVDGKTVHSGSRVSLPGCRLTAQRAVRPWFKWQTNACENDKRIDSCQKWCPCNKWLHAGVGQEGRSIEGLCCNVRTPVGWTVQEQPCRYCGRNTPAETMPSVWQDVCGVWLDGTLQEGLL